MVAELTGSGREVLAIKADGVNGNSVTDVISQTAAFLANSIQLSTVPVSFYLVRLKMESNFEHRMKSLLT